jgi:hypothetical protein
MFDQLTYDLNMTVIRGIHERRPVAHASSVDIRARPQCVAHLAKAAVVSCSGKHVVCIVLVHDKAPTRVSIRAERPDRDLTSSPPAHP